MAKQYFNPDDIAAASTPPPTGEETKTKPKPKGKPLKPEHLAALDPVKKRPVILPPKKANEEVDHTAEIYLQRGELPPPTDTAYWKKNPLITEHRDGTIRLWGEDTVARRNPNLLPQQMLPPPPIPIDPKQRQDYFEKTGSQGSGRMRYHQY